jgi:sugar/nucleoside kinase (ribokinase family)
MKNYKFDVLAIGELNVDLIMNNIDGTPEIGKEKLAGSMTLTLGSSTAIFAANLSSLGSKVGFLGKIGKDSFGDLVKDSLIDKGIDTSLIIAEDGLATGATVVLAVGEDRANVTYPGAMDYLTIDDISDESLLQAKHIHFSSFFIQPGIRKNVQALFKRAKELGLTTSLDTQWDPSEKWEFDYNSILPWVDVFLPNETEILFLTGTKKTEDAFKKLAPFGKNIVIKQGNKGALLFSENGELYEMPAYLNTKVVDTIGAGDSFNAGFVHMFVKGKPVQKCLDFGNLIGAISTTAAGGTGAFKSKELIRKKAKEKFNVPIDIWE